LNRASPIARRRRYPLVGLYAALVDDAAVTRWLTAYVDAWRSYDPGAIGDLFSADAVYRYHPWDEPTPSHVRGRDAIVASWLGDRDAPGSWTAEYRTWLVNGDRAVAVGVSRYLAPDGTTVEREYHNVFLLVFDDEGRCREFSELYLRRPD
jgi:ketosteroid isomerase-like protein